MEFFVGDKVRVTNYRYCNKIGTIIKKTQAYVIGGYVYDLDCFTFEDNGHIYDSNDTKCLNYTDLELIERGNQSLELDLLI